MNKKNILFSSIIMICLIFSSCSFKNNIIKATKNNKPNNHYYYDKMVNNLNINKNFNIYVLDTNYYQNMPIKGKEISTFLNFIKDINKKDFINTPKQLSNMPPYKIFIEFENDKYVINVYDENYISIFPWDGKYSMDFVSTKKVYKAYNLYGLCKYLIPPDEL